VFASWPGPHGDASFSVMRRGRLVVWWAAGLTVVSLACRRGQEFERTRAPAPAAAVAQTRPDAAAVTRPPQQEARLVEHAVVTLQPLPQIEPDTRPAGTLRLRREGDVSFLTGRIVGLRPGEHGLHIHERGDCSSPDAPGGHFDPNGQPHGAPTLPIDQRHAGDLGNVTANSTGRAEVKMALSPELLERGRYNVLGRSIVLHARRDDLVSQPGGDSGDRVACGVIRAGTAQEEAKAPRVER
jgi:superoxide dismutase, Cu-Zn family